MYHKLCMQLSPASSYVLLSRNILLSTLFMALWDRTLFSPIECEHHSIVVSEMES
jgi:hypothetical protein